jgi:hypothetical protein
MTALVVLEVDPSTARPGWAPLIILLLLAVAMVLLFLSMRRQFRKINVGEPEASPDDEGEGPKSPDEPT